MTRHETFFASHISGREFVLATDLDGTFLGAEKEQRQKFYAWLEANRHQIGLIFVTGRDPAFIQDLSKHCGVPRPDFVVGDVGTTIASVSEDHVITPIEELEAKIAMARGDAGQSVRAALKGAPGLSLQDTELRYRLCYDLDPKTFDARATDIVIELVSTCLSPTIVSSTCSPKASAKGHHSADFCLTSALTNAARSPRVIR